MSEDATAEEMMAAKEAAMNSDECTRSRVSALESGASWYGTLHVGINSAGTAGVVDGGSNWGIKGSSEVSEGLTAVYRFEHKISTENASQPGGRLAYVGLTGGFGSLTIGQIWSASYNSFGAITDNSGFIGDSETSYRSGNAVSYAVSVENISIQVDAIMNKGWGAENTAAVPATTYGGTDAVAAIPEDDNVDQMELGVSMGLGENGKIALAHKSHDTKVDVKTSSNWVGGQYTIGSMTAYLGFGQKKTENNTAAISGNRTDNTTFAGIRGSIADTGVSYLFQARSKKAKGNTGGATANADVAVGANKRSPWLLGLSRSLGGGASVHFEHSNPDLKGVKSTSYLALKVDF
jgi:predicted porin